MPLIKCPACQKEISTQAASCPNCGHPLAKSAAGKSQDKKRLGWFLVIFLFIIFVISSISSSNKTDTSDKTDNRNQSEEPKTQEYSCRYYWTKCADNDQLVNYYSDWSHIQVDCKYAANDQAKYGNPEWPWIPFGSFYKGNNYVTSGIAIAIEPDAQFSNGFGAKVHSRVTCTYDLRAKRVTNVDVSAR
jgi:hypothetical protein